MLLRALMFGLAVAPLILAIAIAQAPPNSRAQGTSFLVLDPTGAYSNDGDLLWEALPGERYVVLLVEADWVLAYWDNDFPASAAWFELDPRIDLVAVAAPTVQATAVLLPTAPPPAPTIPPTTAPTATPPPSGPRLGSRENPVPRSSQGDLGNEWTLTVIQVISNANSLVQRENMFNDPPKAGNQFFMVRISATYSGPGSESFSRGSLELVGASQIAYRNFEQSCGVIPDPLSSRAVFTGGTLTGNLCWEVVRSDVDTLVMYYNRSFPRLQQTFFALS